MDTELKIKLLKENQKEMERLESFNSQSLYLLKFASKLAENNFKIVIYTTRKNNSKFVKIFIGDYLLYRPSFSEEIDKNEILFYFEGFDADMKTNRSKQFKFFEHVLEQLNLK